jgi:CRP/FNR family transcriptional regulator
MIYMEEMPLLLTTATKGVRQKHVPRGQIIIYQGDEPQEALILKKGIVKLYDIDDQGNEKILHIFKPYAVLPFAFFSGDAQPTRWFYSALTDCDICILPADKLAELMSSSGKLTLDLVSWFSLEVHELLMRLNSLGKTNAKAKVTAALKFLDAKHSTPRRSGWMRVNFAVNHQLIADMTGLTRESTAMIMRDFQKRGLIRNPKQTILEINHEKLIDIVSYKTRL